MVIQKTLVLNTCDDFLDSEKSRIIQSSFENYSKADCNKVAAHHNIVIPSFLIIYEYTESESNLVKYLLYNKIDVRKFTCSYPSNQCSNLINKTKTGNITPKATIKVVKFKAVLEKELAANHQN